MTDATLVERLAAHRTIGSAPREQLEWLAEHGNLVRFEPGELIAEVGKPLEQLFVILTGHATIRVDRGAGARMVMEWRGGDISGLLPYSRLTIPPGRSRVEELTEVLTVDRRFFPEMIARCQELTAILVHVMLDRTRRFTKSELHDEKMLSLGRLAAGLAHELNNPASALARSAKELSARLFELEASALALGAVHLTPGQLAAIARVRTQCGTPAASLSLSALERADREQAVAEWLSERGFGHEVAEALADAPLTTESLEALAAEVGDEALGFALHSIGASCRARLLASEVTTAAERVHKLVAAIKGFTYMDQSRTRAPVEVGKGLADTITILAGKARRKSVTLTLEVPEDLPPVDGFGDELNHVWQNLIDNAIDAVEPSGRIEVSARALGDTVTVRVVDDGPGVPADLAERIYEPFFTTKPQGHGTGLGLDIARRLVREHEGHLELSSRPGHTEFRVILPRGRT